LCEIRWQDANVPICARDCGASLLAITSFFYFPLKDGIEVIRVMHGRQDIDADDMM
jgi:hypothetical protein